jgi:hypothetical protein
MADHASSQPSVRRQVTVLIAQLVLVGLVVLASRVLTEGRTATAVIMALAACNGGAVAFGAMGVRRDGWMVSALLAMTAVLIVGLLIWPAVDIAQRARVF